MADCGGTEWRGEAAPGPFENLEQQLRAFEAAAGPQDWARFGEMPGFTEWLAGVAQVSPQSAALSAIWRAALLSLVGGGRERFDILYVASAMTEADATAFLGWAHRTPLPRLPARRLCELGLLRSVFGLSRATPLGARLERLIREIRAGAAAESGPSPQQDLGLGT